MSMTIEEMIKKQQEYFAAGKTCELAQRIQALNRLEQGILNCEQELYAALKKIWENPEPKATCARWD